MMLPLINPCRSNKKARRTKLQVLTRKTRRKSGLAFKSADLALDRKILKEIKSLKKSVSRKNSSTYHIPSHIEMEMMRKYGAGKRPTLYPSREAPGYSSDYMDSLKRRSKKRKNGAAKSGPHSVTPIKKESAMARKRKRARKHVLKMQVTKGFGYKTPYGKKSRKRKASKRSAHKKIVVMSRSKARRARAMYHGAKAHRPVVYKIAGKFYRRKTKKGKIRSRFFGGRKVVRLNGRRRTRRNPFNFSLRSFTNKALLMRVGGLAAGFATGAILMPLVSKGAAKLMPNTSVDKYLGGVHVILGGLLMWKGRKAMVKDFGTTLMASGVYDLIASTIGDKIGLKPFTRDGNFLTQAVGLGASYQPRRLSSSYETVHAPLAASYQMPKLGASYGANVPQAGLSSDWGDDPYETCFE